MTTLSQVRPLFSFKTAFTFRLHSSLMVVRLRRSIDALTDRLADMTSILRQLSMCALVIDRKVKN